MPKYKLVVLSSPVAGCEDAYNDWYQNVHLGQVMTLDGFKSAQRFRLRQALAEHETFPYCALYDIETDDLDALLKEMSGRAGTESLSISDTLAPGAYAVLYEEFGDPVKAWSA